MTAEPIFAYVDTSVFGGVYDSEFEEHSRSFFDQAHEGRFTIVTSPLVLDELQSAPLRVQELYRQFEKSVRVQEVSDPVADLLNSYMDAHIVGERWRADAFHVALATIAGCQVIVSWNFRHIVHMQKILLYNEVNRVNGYPALGIYTPSEVIEYEEEQ